MKIAMVTPRFVKDIRGGGEISCKLLVDNLRKLGIEVDVITADEIFPDIKDTIKLNFAMYSYLKKHPLSDYDVTHTYNMQLLPTVGRLTKKYNLKSVGTLNGHVFSPTFEKRYSKHPIRCSAAAAGLLHTQIKHITRFTVLSECWRKIWINDGIPADKIQVIPNMIPMSYKCSDLIPHNKKLQIIVAGNYSIWRKTKLILDAYSKLPEQDVKLTVVGSGWEKEIDAWRGHNDLEYFPQIPHEDLKPIYNKADVYVQYFAYTGIGRTLLEAALNNTAIVANGAKEDFCELGEAVLFYKDEKTLQERLQYLIDNRKETITAGYNAREIATKYFNPTAVTKKHIRVYKELLND